MYKCIYIGRMHKLCFFWGIGQQQFVGFSDKEYFDTVETVGSWHLPLLDFDVRVTFHFTNDKF
jgi:hypothetical protein